MSNTKSRILESALELFNERGLKNTTLQIIADQLEISVGNLAYHYKNKPEIISAHNIDLQEKLKGALAHYRNFPNFLDFQIQLNHIFQVLKDYRYMFVCLGEIKSQSPETFQTISSFQTKLLLQVESRIEYQLEKGNLHPMKDEVSGTIAACMTDLIFYSPTAHLLEGNLETNHKYLKVWQLLTPFLTEKGVQEWESLISPIIIS
ncbi:MAG: TetR/AcrR family transcriptional regulator [Bacteroidota bacterium]